MTALAPQPLRQRFHVYVDESSQTDHRYMVLGALVLQENDARSLEARLQRCRDQCKLDQEIKWGKVSRTRLSDYVAFAELALESLRTDSPGFYSLVVDTSELDHRRFNAGDPEIGFSKFVYQLLVKCARLFCADGSVMDCFLDQRTTRQTLDELRRILNNGARRHLRQRPFRRVEYRNSMDCNLIQVVDLFTGAVAYHWNGHHLEVSASPGRKQLASVIARHACQTDLARSTPSGRDTFSIWKFAAQP